MVVIARAAAADANPRLIRRHVDLAAVGDDQAVATGGTSRVGAADPEGVNIGQESAVHCHHVAGPRQTADGERPIVLVPHRVGQHGHGVIGRAGADGQAGAPDICIGNGHLVEAAAGGADGEQTGIGECAHRAKTADIQAVIAGIIGTNGDGVGHKFRAVADGHAGAVGAGQADGQVRIAPDRAGIADNGGGRAGHERVGIGEDAAAEDAQLAGVGKDSRDICAAGREEGVSATAFQNQVAGDPVHAVGQQARAGNV